MKPDEFRRWGHALIDWVADYRERVSDLPVVSQVGPGTVTGAVPAEPPEQPEDFADVVRDLDEIVLPAMTHWNHPRHFAYFPANASLSSVLADVVSTGFGSIGANWLASPALTELEEVTCDWMRQLLGLSDSWRGVIQDTASTSTLVALLSARERTLGLGQQASGLQHREGPLIVYCSDQSHSSVLKAALIAGFGRDHVRQVASDDRFALDVDALRREIEKDVAAGARPCALVVTTGTTSTTAIDPVDLAAAVAEEHGLWLHVDGAMAGTAMIVPRLRSLWYGVERADSIVVNAHKWLGAAFDCSLYYVRDPDHLVRVMSTDPSYLQTEADAETTNYRDWGIPLGRRFRALKLWFLLRSEGAVALRRRIERDLGNARWLADQVDAAEPWRRLAPVPLQTVCVRHEPPGLSGDALDEHTLRWVASIERSGVASLTTARIEGRWMVRVSVGAEATERGDVEALWQAMRASVG
ncbi:MAG: pyridoxal-dependent decarboxylase [Acidobacteriota bacterium]